MASVASSTDCCLGFSKEMIAAGVCLCGFVLALPNVTQGGIYFYKLMDKYTCVQSLAILSAVEVVVVLWIFGAGNLA